MVHIQNVFKLITLVTATTFTFTAWLQNTSFKQNFLEGQELSIMVDRVLFKIYGWYWKETALLVSDIGKYE